MNPRRRYAILLLLTVTAGCSTMVAGELPAPADGPDPGWTQTLTVRPKDDVRLTLHDGRRVSGTVARVDADRIALGKAGNYGWEETVFAREDLARIEVRRDTIAGKVFGTTLTMMAVVALGAILLASQIDWPAS